MLRVGALTLAMMLYNQIFHGDDEEELSEYDRNRLHIVLGRDKNGNVRIIRGQGALADFLEWFGLDSAPTLWREYLDGKASLADLFGRIPFTDLPAFGLNPFEGKIGLHPMALKMIRAISPIYKLPFELMTGKQAPVFDDASWKIEDKLRHVLRSISLENEYDLFTRKPSRGYGRSLAEAFITTQDPGENAYRYIQGEKYKWLETHKGRGGSGDYYSPNSILYRQYRKALFYKDEAAQERIKAKMDEMGITQKDLKRSLETADPLSGLSRKDRAEFINHYLTQRDREVMLDRAMLYYRKTFKGEK
jgi:hypothetical protein